MTNLKDSGRVLYISSVDVSEGNGPGVNEREFILGLRAAMGDRAHFLIPRPAGVVPELPDEACTYSLPIGNHSPLRFPAHVASQILCAQRVLSRDRFDMLLFRLDVLPLAPFYITRRHRVPYAVKTLGQGLVNSLPERGGRLGRSLVGVNRRLVGRLVAGALVADSVSTLQVERLRQAFSAECGKIVWIDNAVNTKRFYPISTAEARNAIGINGLEPIVGYVGTRPWERGGRHLIEAAPGLLSRFPNLGVVILGGGEGVSDLQQRARDLGIEGHCLFVGRVPFEKVPLYVNSLDVGVSISVRPDRNAASELKVRQYLACGKPVVVSPGGNEFVVEEQLGSVVGPDDPRMVAAELEKWLSLSGNERQSFARRAVRYMTDHRSIDAAVSRRLELWSEKLVGQG